MSGGFFGSAITDRSGKFHRRDDFAGLEEATGDRSVRYALESPLLITSSYDFDETYDGLGDQLEETNDDFNDDTFGDSGAIGKDFDFSGKTAKTAEVLEDEQLVYERRTMAQRTPMIDRSTDPWAQRSNEPVWGQQGSGPLVQPVQPAAKKMQTLEEIEAEMLARASAPRPPQQQSQPHHQHPQPVHQYHQQSTQSPGFAHQPMPMMRPPGFGPVMMSHQMPMQAPLQHQPMQQPMPVQQQSLPPEARPMPPGMPAPQQRQPLPINLKETMADDEEARRLEQQKNLRRAQKIGQMARYNGLMSNGDKNYVLKVQLSQLVSEDPEADDFYYTVHSTLRGRSNLQQSLGHFEQTYLGRPGQNRRGRDNKNPLLKMQQQVQKVIAASKARPKSTSLTVEGSLGKLSFSRVRQPKQVLNVQALPETAVPHARQSKLEALQAIEAVYNELLVLEQTSRQAPGEDAPQDAFAEWRAKLDEIADGIWRSLQVESDSILIEYLNYAKGKKMIPRLFRGLNAERRLALVQCIVQNLDKLAVVRLARYENGVLPREVREEIELFSQTVLPPLLAYASSAPLPVIASLLTTLLDSNNINLLCMTKVGLSFLTMLISRAEIAKAEEGGAQAALWQQHYNIMFSKLEGRLALIFPPIHPHAEEGYPWQFLAACAVSASPEQQHALVNEARDKVLEQVASAKVLPREMADLKRAHVNLFLNAIGLDASQLEG
jgi:DNA topoisomerase 2-associated protein PAT1